MAFVPLAIEGAEAAPEIGAAAAEAGGVISRGFKFVKGLLGGGGGGTAQKLAQSASTQLAGHDIAKHFEGGSGGQRPSFGTPGYDGVPANVSSSQFGGL